MFYYFVLVFLGTCLFSFAIYYFGKKAKVKRKLKRAAAQNLGDIKNGDHSKVVGKLEYYHETLIAPISGRKCVFYDIWVTGVLRHKKASWQKILEDDHAVDFVLNQDGNKALIHVKNHLGYLIKDEEIKLSENKAMYDNIAGYLKENGLDISHYKEVTFFEGILEEGEDVAVKGIARWESEIENLKNSKTGDYLVMHAGQDRIVISDDPKTLD